MDVITRALEAVGAVIVGILGLLLGLFAGLDHWLRGVMAAGGLPTQVQTAVIIILAILFIIAALRLLGGVFRLLIIVFLILLLLHVVFPGVIPADQGVPT